MREEEEERGTGGGEEETGVEGIGGECREFVWEVAKGGEDGGLDRERERLVPE